MAIALGSLGLMADARCAESRSQVAILLLTRKGASLSVKPIRSRALAVVLGLGVFSFVFYFTTGFFVIQPIGAIPQGTTVWYWRYNTQFPFISSADGLLVDKQGGVSLLGRGVALAALSEPITQRKIASFPYSQTLYLISTGGRQFDR
jgi:hypothetical protein